MPRAFKIKMVVEGNDKHSCRSVIALLQKLVRENISAFNVIKWNGKEIPYKSQDDTEMAKGGAFCLAGHDAFVCTKRIGHKDALHIAHDYSGHVINKWK